MGIITNLIQMNQKKKADDTEKHLKANEFVLQQLAGMTDEDALKLGYDSVSDMKAQIAPVAIGNITQTFDKNAGKEYKGAGGVLKHMLSGLAGLNPAPGDPLKGQQVPQIGAGKTQRSQEEVDSALEARQKKQAMIQSQLEEAKEAAKKKADEAARETEIQNRADELTKAKDKGLLDDEQYKTALAEIYTGRTVAQPRREPNLQRVHVKGPDGVEFIAMQDPANGALQKVNGQKLDPDQYQLVDKEGTGAKDTPEVRMRIEKYMSDGMSREAATKKALADAVKAYDTREKSTEVGITVKQANEQDKRERRAEVPDIVAGIKSGVIPPDSAGLIRDGVWGKVVAQLGKDGYNLKTAEADWMGMKQHMRTLNGAQQTRLRQATEFATESLDLIDNPKKPGDDLLGQLRQSVPRTQFPVLNKAALSAAKQGVLGEKAASAARQIENQIADLQSEIATVYKGGNSPTDIGLGQAKKILDSDWSEQTLRDAINLTRKNLGLRLNSIKVVGAIDSSGNESGQGGGGGTPPTTTDPNNPLGLNLPTRKK